MRKTLIVKIYNFNVYLWKHEWEFPLREKKRKKKNELSREENNFFLTL